MPADTVYGAPREQLQYRPGIRGTRHGPKDDGEGSHTREIELKRSRGEISCAECRRLKIKCDKQLPCSSCLRRGCSLATGQGTRFVLAATDHLHRRISKMSERIRQLEDALAILQLRDSEEPHPLLRDELLSMKIEKGEEVLDTESGQDIPKDLGGLGTLSISDKGSQRFFGASGGSEILFLNDDDETNHSSPSASNSAGSPVSLQASIRDSKSPPLQPDVALFSNAFPFTPTGPACDVREKIMSHLPPWDSALALVDIYFEQAAWLFRSVSRQQLIDEMLPVLYRRVPPSPAHEHGGNYDGPHALALLLMTFAVGTLVDLRHEPYSMEADHYYQLAKAAITLQSVLERPELVTVQALHLMSIYNAMRQPDIRDEEGGTSMEMSWSLIRLCHQLAQTSLATGRPPSITLPYIDCAFPLDDEAHLNNKGETEPGFGSWGFRFACECVGQVAAKTLTASIPSYSAILELDAKIRDFPIPEFPQDTPLDKSKPSMVMMRYVLAHTRETSVSFFAQAMIDDPVNPLRSQYAPSFLATYRCASHILKSIREEFDLLPELSARFWPPWTFAFSSAVVFGTVVTRGPSSSMAPSSLHELDAACELFSRASGHSRRAAKAYIILQKLQTKAHAAYDACLRTKAAPDTTGEETPVLRASVQEKDDELDMFSGRVRLVSSKRCASSTGGSPIQADPKMPNGNHTLTPPPSQSVPSSEHTTLHAMSSSSPISPISAMSGVSHMHNLSATRSSDSIDGELVYPQDWTDSNNVSLRDLYSERGPGTYTVSSSEYPAAVVDEWATSPTATALLVEHTQSQHSLPPGAALCTLEFTFVSFWDGRDGHHAHPVSQPQHHVHPPHPPLSHPHSQHGHSADPRFHHAFSVPPPPPPSSQSSAYYHSPNGTSPPGMCGVGYGTAPRELAEMGLASQHSGLNQRWTSFMQDSGLFYGSGSSM
ncbi:hypothetical protein EW145_g3096 [Phellinidium pouzarii]|uniref:Zn(2)-C6 fungal-type domain-containing protein n=1 Tax=Phellinidium pouzarii TaxID=167371 RepID=A0A4V3XCZ8_9AGAM|nr:hypothetical protein EW145_g3096 [Phellinidium pouzarii]